MPCYSPIYLKINELVDYRKAVPCGKCIGCLNKRRSDWTFRLLQENHVAKSSAFLTLTYNDNFLPIINGVPTLSKADLQRYIKRLRKVTENLKYYAVGEYGDIGNRPHYHAIVFNATKENMAEKWSEDGEVIGRISIDPVSQADIHYVTKYMINSAMGYKKKVKPFAVMSKGIGKVYVDKNKEYHNNHMNNFITYPGGQKGPMPRYYREKLYDEETRRKIGTMSQLQKHKIWVDPDGVILPETAQKMIARQHNSILRTKRNSKSKNC